MGHNVSCFKWNTIRPVKEAGNTTSMEMYARNHLAVIILLWKYWAFSLIRAQNVMCVWNNKSMLLPYLWLAPNQTQSISPSIPIHLFSSCIYKSNPSSLQKPFNFKLHLYTKSTDVYKSDMLAAQTEKLWSSCSGIQLPAAEPVRW